jgi:hypothetical protein
MRFKTFTMHYTRLSFNQTILLSRKLTWNKIKLPGVKNRHGLSYNTLRTVAVFHPLFIRMSRETWFGTPKHGLEHRNLQLLGAAFNPLKPSDFFMLY